MSASAEATRIAALQPEWIPRACRLGIGRGKPLRVAWLSDGGCRERRFALVRLTSHGLHRLRQDPLLRSQPCFRARNWEQWTRGECGDLELEELRSGRRRSVAALPLGEIRRPADAASPRRTAAARPLPPAPAGRASLPLRWPRRGSPETAPADAAWVPWRASRQAFAILAQDPAVRWKSLRVYRADGGFVVAGRTPSLRRSPSCIPLRAHRFSGGSVLFAERGLRLPAALLSLECPAAVALARVEAGRVRLSSLVAPPSPAAELLAPRARPRRWSEVAADPSPGAGPAELDLRSASAATELGRWLGERRARSTRLERELREAFGEPSVRDAAPLQGRRSTAARPTSKGWLRNFASRRLPEGLRRRIDAWNRRQLRDPRARRRVIRRQRDALSHLLRKLAGEEWREGMVLAFPLRAPGDREPCAPWLAAGAHLASGEDEFSLEEVAEKAALGAIGVGAEIYAEFRSLYEQAARRFLEARECRRAARVLSYLLGKHEKAAAVLEQGGFPREAATVYYHLAGKTRKAAVALERGRAFADAARIWMDLREWRRAALAWERAANESQARAAWKKVAMDLREGRRFLEAAEVLAGRLGDADAALEVLRFCALELGHDSLEAAERARSLWISLGDLESAASLLRDVEAAITDAAERSPGRRSFQLLLRWAARRASWCGSEPSRAPAAAARAREAWLTAIELWGRARKRVHPALREEMDSLALQVAREQARVAGDPWLEEDVEAWFRLDAPRPLLASRAVEATEEALPLSCRALHVREDLIYTGTDGGEVVLLDARTKELERCDTGTARPVADVQGRDAEIYASVDEEVHHFTRLPGRGGGGLPPLRPVQIERTLPGRVTRLLLMPDGSALLRVTVRHVHILHPVHLLPMETLIDAGKDSIVAAALNRRYFAVILRQAGENPAESGHWELWLYQRRIGARKAPMRLVERFPIDTRHPRRLFFQRSDTDDFFVVGEEHLAFFPTRRELVRCFELAVGDAGGRLEPPRLASVAARRVALLAYGDGSLERIHLETAEREFLLDPPTGPLDALVGFEVREYPFHAWMLHRSGRLRSIAEF